MNETGTIRDAYRYCEELVRRCDRDHYLAGLFASAQRRKFLYALYAFAFELAQVKSRVSAPVTGAIRLQWWHDAVMGLRDEEAAANPVIVALADAARQTATPLETLTVMIEAREAELDGHPATEAIAATFVMAARFLGVPNGNVAAVVDAAARAVNFAASEPQEARKAYAVFLANVGRLPKQVLPAFLTVALVPLRLRHRPPGQLRRQIALLRATWFGFPRI